MEIGKKRLGKIILGILLIFICYWGGSYLLEKIPAFHLATISKNGLKHCDPQEIEQFTDEILGKCIFKIDLTDLFNRIKTIGWVKDVSIRRVLPNSLTISVQERVPLVMLETDQLYLIDREGVIISPAEDGVWKLPIITGLSLKEKNAGTSSLCSVLSALELIQDFKVKWLSEVSEISMEDPENIIFYNKKKDHEIRLGLNNLQQKVIYLKTICKDIQFRVTGIEYIDLRYKNQIVVKSHKQIS